MSTSFIRKIFSLCLLALLLGAPAALAQGVLVPPQVAFKTVNGITTPIANATITVCAALTGGIPCSPALVSAVFRDAALTQPLSNPFTSDSSGNYQFAIAAGNYTVTVTASGFSGYSYQTTAGGSSSGSSGISGLTAGQVPIANSATSLSSSKPLQGTDTNILTSGVVGGTGSGLCADGNGGATTSACAFLASFANITTGTNTNTLTESGAGSIAPATTAQISGTSLFATEAGIGQVPAAPTFTNFTQTGGALPNGNAIAVVITFNTASGESLPSLEAFAAMNQGACVSGSACTVTVALPATCTSPTAPITGCTVYSASASGITAKGQEKQQTVSASCVNVTANCVISAPGLGAVFPAKNTTGPNPANAQATKCGVGINPFAWYQDNSGLSQTWIGIDPFSANGQTGTPEFCARTWFTDRAAQDNSAPQGHNAFVLIDHSAGTGTSTSNQDRALWVGNSTPSGDSATRYAVEGIQAEVDFNCNGCSINGAPDGEVSTASLQMSDLSITSATAATPQNVVRASYFKSGAGAGQPTMDVYYGNWVFNNAAAVSAGTQARVLDATCTNSVGGTISNLSCWGMKFTPAANRFANGQSALVVLSGLTPGSNDFLIRSDVASYDSITGGKWWLAGLGTVAGTIPVQGSLNLTGGLATTQLAVPTANTACSLGSGTTWVYQIVAKDVNGGAIASSTLSRSCNATLDGSHTVTISTGTSAGATTYDIYRVTSPGTPSTTGKIGSASPAFSAATTTPLVSLVDNGLAGDGSTPPSTNTTGSLATPPGAITYFPGNHAQVASNFTTAATTSLQTITGLTYTLPPAAANYSFHCGISYSQGTANAAVAFGIQSATVAATNIFANGTEQITVGPPATVVTGTLATLASTTATNIVSGTPGATATNYAVYLDGTIEEPANNAGNIINFMVSTATSADAVTVLRGSYCHVF